MELFENHLRISKNHKIAFDTVDHDILLQILNAKYGIAGQALKWFDNYLSERSFKVVIGNQI